MKTFDGLDLMRSRPARISAVALTWTIVLSGCGGGDGGPSTSPTATPTSTANTTATANATANGTATATGTITGTPVGTATATPNLTTGPTLVPVPTGTPAPNAPLQFRGFYLASAAVGAPSPPLSFRVNALGQVAGQTSVIGASGVSFVILVRGTLTVPAGQANDLNATAYLNLRGSGASGGQILNYRFTGTVARNTAAIVIGSGTAQTQLGDQVRGQTIQVTRQSS